jgi:hypothetical protein
VLGENQGRVQYLQMVAVGEARKRSDAKRLMKEAAEKVRRTCVELWWVPGSCC